MKKKPWSITTTLRNPERLRNFLIVLKELEGVEWDSKNQQKYQIMLIKERIYGYENPQFYNGLEQNMIDLIDNRTRKISFKEAKEIFITKNYEDPAMRGRQSINPLKKMGFVSIKNKKIFITDLGKLFLKDDFDLGEIFFKSFIKWQIPNPASTDYKLKDGYNIKPFVGILHLINIVNKKSLEMGEKPKGISKQEFSLFAPALIHFEYIEKYVEKIIALREKQKNKNIREQKQIFNDYQKHFAKEFLDSDNEQHVDKLLKNLKDYGDNAIRYFRLTRFIYIRGGGFYVDLEPRRKVEIENLLIFDTAQAQIFKSKEQYLEYIADVLKPRLPWESKKELSNIILHLIKDIQSYEKKLSTTFKTVLEYQSFNEAELKNYIAELRQYRRELQDKKNHEKLQEINEINNCIEKLKHIFNFDDKPILLEKLSFLGLSALNDALKIKANYPVGDDNEPTFTAPSNTPDIECYYQNFNAICEVTMLTGRNQWYHEGQPVMRHLRSFENQNKILSYCIFIAPKLHKDTINTFWTAIKYEYEGKKQNIVPLSISQFTQILEFQVILREKQIRLTHTLWENLLKNISELRTSCKSSEEWINSIPSVINDWKNGIIKYGVVF